MPFLALSAVLSLICAPSLSAQTRLSDKGVLPHMKNLKDDAKIPFQLQQRTFHEHHPEDHAGAGREDAGAEFREADKFHVRAFKNGTKAYLQNCLDTARQIDKIMTSTPMDPAGNTQCSTVKDRTQYPRTSLSRVRALLGYC